MILIADSGSTKTNWSLINKEKCLLRVSTKGMNPFFQTDEEMSSELQETLLPYLSDREIDEIYLYGAGCTPEKAPIVARVLRSLFPEADPVKVYSDMLGAAHGLCGREAGIVCILGTGSNSCYYDGTDIVANVSPLGFILGDEGSGAVLGKLLVGDILKNQLTPELKEAFLTEYQLTPADIIDRVYRKPFPNRFLAGLSPFLKAHLDHPQVHALVLNSFKAFIKRNVMQYRYQDTPVHFIGSVAHHYSEVLKQAADEMGIRLGRISQNPMEGLIQYYQQRESSF